MRSLHQMTAAMAMSLLCAVLVAALLTTKLAFSASA
jgi:hypothetical protein